MKLQYMNLNTSNVWLDVLLNIFMTHLHKSCVVGTDFFAGLTWCQNFTLVCGFTCWG